MLTQPEWVKESSFGMWFLGTDIWVDFVLRKALQDLEPLIPQRDEKYSQILDIGCGFGHSLLLLDKKFSPDKLIGLDVDPGVPQRAAQLVSECNSKLAFLTCNAEQIKLPDESFDMVFCHQSFHHIIQQELAIKEFYRVLKPGGILLFAESCRRFIHSMIIKLLFRHPMDVQKTAEEYVNLIRQTGFELGPDQISKPYLWWSRWDLALFEHLGISPNKQREETMINLVAIKPAA